MTDGQQSNYFARFERSFVCSNCGYHGLHDIEVFDVDNENIDYDSFEIEQEPSLVIEDESTNATIVGIIIIQTIEIEQEMNKIILDYYLQDENKKELVLDKEFIE